VPVWSSASTFAVWRDLMAPWGPIIPGEEVGETVGEFQGEGRPGTMAIEVLDSDGRWSGTVEAPMNRRLYQIGAGRAEVQCNVVSSAYATFRYVRTGEQGLPAL
jgi:hypothetical protein